MEKSADDLIVNAFGYYSDNCYRPDLNNSSAYEADEKESADNGESNNEDEIIVDILSNNPNSKFLTIGAIFGMNSFSSPNIKLGPDISYYKKGLYLNAHGFISRYAELNEPEGIDAQYGGYFLASIPFIKKAKKPKRSYLSLGQMQGLETMAKSEDAELYYFTAISLESAKHFYVNILALSFVQLWFFGSASTGFITLQGRIGRRHSKKQVARWRY